MCAAVIAIDVGVRNFAVLAATLDGRFEIIDWTVEALDATDGVHSVCQSLAALLSRVYDKVLQTEPRRLDVLIESQMKRKYACIGHAAAMFFAAQLIKPFPFHIAIVPAHTKFNRLGFPVGTLTYAQRKAWAVERAEAWLGHAGADVWRAKFAGTRKKDDLADVLLMALNFALQRGNAVGAAGAHAEEAPQPPQQPSRNQTPPPDPTL